MDFLVYIFIFLYTICHNLHIFVSGQSRMYDINYSESVKFDISSFPSFKIISTSKTYTVSLRKEKSLFSRATEVLIYKGNQTKQLYLHNIPGSSLYEGTVRGYKNSSAIGYFYRNEFIGKIDIENEIYFLEPGSYHSSQAFDQTMGVFYKIKNVRVRSKFSDGNRICDTAKINSHDEYNDISDSHLSNSSSKIKVDHLKVKRRICSLELIADHTYVKYMEFNHAKIIAEMLYHIKIADKIFRNTDVDLDGIPDDVGFTVEKISIFEKRNDPGYTLGIETADNELFLKLLTDYRHTKCFLICFTHRDFWTKGKCAVGNINLRGGICARGTKQTDKNVYNVAFVTGVERNSIIPRFRITLSILHQLGHAFGCGHDPQGNVICSPGDFDKTKGNFVMYPKVPYGSQPNNWKYSSCCRQAMRNLLTITVIERCLTKIEESKCQNGILEVGEACECDSLTKKCKEIEKCCIPAGRPFQCTIRDGKICSPGTAECCDEDCKIIPVTKNKTCFSNHVCFNHTTICDGTSPFCPGSVQADRTPCLGTSGTCLKGACISNVCLDNGLKLCQCETSQTECHICCQNTTTSTCVPAKDLGYFPSKDQFYVKIPESSCDQGYGICTSNGTCVRKFSTKMYTVWHFLAAIPFVIIIFAMLNCYFVEREKRISIIERAEKIRTKSPKKHKRKMYMDED